MNRPSEGPSEGGGAAGILRAVGSLLVALSAADNAAAERILAESGLAQPSAPPPFRYPPASRPEPRYEAQRDDVPPYSTRYEPRFDQPAYRAPARADDAEFVLADARERARRILDESMERARELMRGGRPTSQAAADAAASEDLRRVVDDLLVEVRDMRQSTARIETMLREWRDTTVSRRDTAAQTPQPVAQTQPAPEAPRSAAPEAYAPPAPSPEPAREPAHAPPAPPPDFPPSSNGNGEALKTASVASAPASGGETPPSMPRARYAGSPLPSPAPAPPWDRPGEPPLAMHPPAPIATFLPVDGSIALRVSPVAGFQGLMRVQDALARLPSVHHAGVEAYSQGEARLRLELSEATDSEAIALGLSRSLKEPAYVQQASETDRELSIALR